MRIADLPFPEKQSGNVDLQSGYAHTLRAIGQALESLDLGDFSMEPAGDGYHVTGATVTKYPDSVRSAGGERGARDPKVRSTPIDLNYSQGDVRRLEREGQTQRVETHGMTDSSRLSQALAQSPATCARSRSLNPHFHAVFLEMVDPLSSKRLPI